jgi:hypothetical protein
MIGRLAVGCYAYSLPGPCEKGLAAQKVEIEAACATRNEQGGTGTFELHVGGADRGSPEKRWVNPGTEAFCWV